DLYENVYNDEEKERMADNITNAMAGVSSETEERIYAYWGAVSPRLEKRVRDLYENVYNDEEKERMADNITNAMAGVSSETEER
ncbi:hypothetical protein HT105_25000, partial [Bacteroides fragilis]|nr:hypothetical protein [Bacteroides fragilis]